MAVASALAKVLIIPGLNGSGPEHWQTLREQERVDGLRIEQANWRNPDPLDWISRIDNAVAGICGPVVFAAHSLGCLAIGAWAAVSQRATDGRFGGLWVAPCDPSQEGTVEGIRRFGMRARAVTVSVGSRCQLERSLCQLWGRTGASPANGAAS